MKCIHELFAAQAALTPDAVAVAFEEENLTYSELDERTNVLAERLRADGVCPDVLVALLVERSFDMVVGMLGILKAGGAYIPLDPTHPSKRLAYMLADAQPPILLTQKRLKSDLPPHNSRVVLIDDDSAQNAQSPHKAGSPLPAKLADLAYVIYTSGSTGEPKGVLIEHGSLVNLLESMRRRLGVSASDKILAIATLTFDISVLEIFLPLTCGGSVVIARSDTVGDGPALIDLIQRSDVSVVQATPATLRMLLDAGWAGGRNLKILCGGEAWGAELASRLLDRCGKLWNGYGPTEATIYSAVAKIEVGKPVVIGRPIANTQVYVLKIVDQLCT